MIYRGRDTATYDGVQYRPDRLFRVVKACTLDGMKPIAPNAHKGWRQDLQPGDIVLCTGYGAGWGGDPGFGVEFSTERSRTEHVSHCEIRPSHGGMWAFRPRPGLLEPYEYGLNRAATWQVYDNDDEDPPKGCVEIGGVQVYVYFDDGELVVSLHYDGAEAEITTAQQTIPTRVLAGDGATVWQEP